MSDTYYCCEACFSRFPQSHMQEACMNEDCIIVPQQDDSHLIQELEMYRARSRQHPEYRNYNTVLAPNDLGRKACTNCGNTEQFYYLCPSCHVDVFTEPPMPYKETFTIALVGPRSSGKTVYMVGLYLSLREACERSNYYLYTDKRFLESYLNKIKGSELLAATETTRQEDIVFQLKGGARGDECKIIIRDIAGEIIEKAEGYEPELCYLDHADLVISLYDPAADPNIMNRLRGKVSSANIERIDPSQIIFTLTSKLISADNYRTLVALVISKFDLIHTLAESGQDLDRDLLRNQGAAFFTDMNIQSFDALCLLEADTRSLLDSIGGRNYLNAASVGFQRKRDRLGVFPVSALGQAPEGDQLQNIGVSPFGCLNPVLWGFWKLYGRPLFIS